MQTSLIAAVANNTDANQYHGPIYRDYCLSSNETEDRKKGTGEKQKKKRGKQNGTREKGRRREEPSWKANARATWWPQSPMDVDHPLWGLDFVSDDLRAVLNAREEEHKEFLDKEKEKTKAKVVALHEKGSGVSSKRTIFNDQELRYKDALRRYWTDEDCKKSKTLAQVATGMDLYPEDTEKHEEMRKTVSVVLNTLRRHKTAVTKAAREKYCVHISVMPTNLQLCCALDEYEIEAIGNKNLKKQQFFSCDELNAITALIVEFQLHGFPLSANQISDYINDIADEIVARCPELDANRPCFDSRWVRSVFLNRPMNKEIKQNLTKTSSIDPKRAEQADPEVGRIFFRKLDEFLKEKNKTNPGLFKYKCLADIPANELYNIDEFGSDTTEKKSMVAIVRNIVQYLGGLIGLVCQRQYTKGEGDKNQGFHVTVVQCSRADGRYRWYCKLLKKFTDGAVCPMIIHSLPSKGGKGATCNRESDSGEACAPDKASTININYAETGIKVCCTKNGSMERLVFREYAKHFVSQLPPGYGKGGKMVYLFLDGHSSRWDLMALRYFEENNVCVICLPSHTSIWSQPNDGKCAPYQPWLLFCLTN